MPENLDVTRARRQSPGTVYGLIACGVATLAVGALALQGGAASPGPVSYELPGDQVLTESKFDAATAIAPATLLEQFYLTGDARYLMYATAELEDASAREFSDEITLVRLESAAHRFENAADRAGKVLDRRPRDAEARLLRADALRRSGDISAARRDCVALALLSDAVAGHWCAVQVLLSEGRTPEAHEQAQALLGAEIRTSTEVERWYAAISAEAAALAGFHDTAAITYEKLTADAGSKFSERIAYADVLLHQRRAAAVLELLANDRGRLPAQIRIALAAKQRGEPPAESLLSSINDAFADMSSDVTDDLRLRDRAVFELRYRDDPQAALRFARANWRQQKGPEDLSLLTESASAANDIEVLQVVEQWKSRFRDEGRQ